MNPRDTSSHYRLSGVHYPTAHVSPIKSSSNGPSKTGTVKRRKSKPKWTKPKDMPKRPLSAYNLFFSEERRKLLEEGSGALGGFSGLSQKVASKWKSLDHTAKAPFVTQAKEERKRYKKEMKAWRNGEEDEEQLVEVASHSDASDMVPMPFSVSHLSSTCSTGSQSPIPSHDLPFPAAVYSRHGLVLPPAFAPAYTSSADPALLCDPSLANPANESMYDDSMNPTPFNDESHPGVLATTSSEFHRRYTTFVDSALQEQHVPFATKAQDYQSLMVGSSLQSLVCELDDDQRNLLAGLF